MTGRADYYVPGDWNVVCYQCGRKRKASTMRQHWQGYWVCPEHWEARQPQDFVRGVQDIQTVPWTQPANDTFATFCTPNGITAIVDYAIVDCAIVDYKSPLFVANAPFSFTACLTHSSIAGEAIAGCCVAGSLE